MLFVLILLASVAWGSASMYENFYSIHSKLTNPSVLIGVGVFAGINTLRNVLFLQPILKNCNVDVLNMIEENESLIARIDNEWKKVIESQQHYAAAKNTHNAQLTQCAWEKYYGMQEYYEKNEFEGYLKDSKILLARLNLQKAEYDRALRWSCYTSIGSFLTLSGIIGYRYWLHCFSRFC